MGDPPLQKLFSSFPLRRTYPDSSNHSVQYVFDALDPPLESSLLTSTLKDSTASKKKKHTQTVNNTQPPSWVRKRCTLTWSLSATSIPESPPPLVTRSTSAVELTSVPSRSSRRKPPSWARVHSSMRGFLTS